MKKSIIVVSSLILTFNAAAGKRFSENHKINQEQPKPEQIMEKLDENKDGKISKKEAKGPLEADFNKVDANNDGFISLEELKKLPKPPKKNNH